MVAPVTLVMTNSNSDSKLSTDESQYVMYLGIVRSTKQLSPTVFKISELTGVYIFLVIILIGSIILATFSIFQTSHSVIRPLR